RVMSYNVNFGVAGDPSTIDAIANAQPDVVFLQETNEVWQRALVARLGTSYPHQRFTHPETWPAGGMGLLSKYPVIALQHLDSVGGYFFAWRVVLDTKLGRIQVLNVHLRPPMSDGGSWVVGYWSTRSDRLREIENHIAALDPKLPTIILGDFNEEGDGRAVELLKDRGYGDALPQFVGKTRTWEWPVGSITLRFQLDHIMHDGYFVPVTGAIVEGGHSDHKAIWVDFERIDP
ncbi:MAG TPA: endonuclease/exonuclease/phosphatase family protein, partial [Kofleriaceae bacterium]|nr:endonuclease/exonuclease/phosphatase family protein [Kofleriaceae bacterium]